MVLLRGCVVLRLKKKKHIPPPSINPNVFDVSIELFLTHPLRRAPASASEPSRTLVRCKRDPFRTRPVRGILGAGASGDSRATPAGPECPVALQERGQMWHLIKKQDRRRQKRNPHLPLTIRSLFPRGKKKTLSPVPCCRRLRSRKQVSTRD